MKNDLISFIEEHKIIAICRKTYGMDLYNVIQAIQDGGTKLVEVTFDQADPQCIAKTTEAIAMLCSKFKNSIHVGAGTVLTKEQVKAAKDAGAEYIISPNTDTEIIKYTKELGLVSIPGAFTPSEILSAHQAGADFVKLFPAGALGLSYFKDITAPISHVKIIATGGVNATNLLAHLEAGFVGAGISGYLSEKKLVANGEFDTLKSHAIELSSIVNNFRR